MKEKTMSDREILDKYVDVDKSCLADSEKKQVMDMLYKYKDAFSLRDEIGTCPNIEVVLCKAMWASMHLASIPLKMSRGSLLQFMHVGALSLHNCSSSGSLFFVTLRQNN